MASVKLLQWGSTIGMLVFVSHTPVCTAAVLILIPASSAKTALAAANAFVSLGLKDLGYQYINIDDAWSTMSRSNGLLVPDPNKWPNGVTPVAKQIHDMGLKLGMLLSCSDTKADM
jgi:hypothetical protein